LRDYRLYLEEIVEACDRVLAYIQGKDRATFFSDRVTRDAVLWNLLTIGEAIKNVPREVRERHPGVEWRKVAGFRDVVAHEYFAIDHDIVWDVLENKVGPLRDLIRGVLDAEKGQ